MMKSILSSMVSNFGTVFYATSLTWKIWRFLLLCSKNCKQGSPFVSGN
jgi:hypothetical protein